MENFNEFDQTTTPNQESGSIISHALELFKNSFLYCFLAVIIYYLISYLVQPISGFDSNSFIEVIKEQSSSGSQADFDEVINVPGFKTYTGLSFLVSILLAPIYIGLIYVANKANFKQKISISDIFFAYKQNFLNIILYTIISAIALTIAVSLCILPFFFIAPFFFLGYPILIFENASVGEALKKSFKIAQNNYSKILITSFLSMLIAISGLLLCFVGVYLTMPFIYIAMYSTYAAFLGAPKQIN